MARIQAVVKVKSVEIYKTNANKFIYTISAYERCYSKSRQKAQQEIDLKGEKGDGVYFMWHTLKVFSAQRHQFVEKLNEGDMIDFSGNLEEEAFKNKDGDIRKRLIVVMPDLKKVFAPDGSRSDNNSKPAQQKSPKTKELVEDVPDDDDYPF